MPVTHLDDPCCPSLRGTSATLPRNTDADFIQAPGLKKSVLHSTLNPGEADFIQIYLSQFGVFLILGPNTSHFGTVCGPLTVTCSLRPRSIAETCPTTAAALQTQAASVGLDRPWDEKSSVLPPLSQYDPDLEVDMPKSCNTSITVLPLNSAQG